MQKISTGICLKKTNRIYKNMENNTEKICLEEINKKRKNTCNNIEKTNPTICWKKFKKNELKSIEVDVVTTSIKDRVESFINDNVDDVNVDIVMMNMIRSLDLAEIWVASNGIFSSI